MAPHEPFLERSQLRTREVPRKAERHAHRVVAVDRRVEGRLAVGPLDLLAVALRLPATNAPAFAQQCIKAAIRRSRPYRARAFLPSEQERELLELLLGEIGEPWLAGHEGDGRRGLGR